MTRFQQRDAGPAVDRLSAPALPFLSVFGFVARLASVLFASVRIVRFFRPAAGSLPVDAGRPPRGRRDGLRARMSARYDRPDRFRVRPATGSCHNRARRGSQKASKSVASHN